MTKLATGPIRQRRIIQCVWLPGLVVLSTGVSAGSLLLLVLGCACAARVALTRVEIEDGSVTVVNFFRTVRLPPGSVRSAGFARGRWHGFPVPLVLVGEGIAVRASGVSAWMRAIQWPDQPFVTGRRSLERCGRFFASTGIAFDPRVPVRGDVA